MKQLSFKQVHALEFNQKLRGVHIKHTDVFENDDDMIRTLAAITEHPMYYVVKGTAWFEMCAKAVKGGYELSPKQVTQARRQGASVIDFLSYLTMSNDNSVNDAILKEFYATIK